MKRRIVMAAMLLLVFGALFVVGSQPAMRTSQSRTAQRKVQPKPPSSATLLKPVLNEYGVLVGVNDQEGRGVVSGDIPLQEGYSVSYEVLIGKYWQRREIKVMGDGTCLNCRTENSCLTRKAANGEFLAVVYSQDGALAITNAFGYAKPNSRSASQVPMLQGSMTITNVSGTRGDGGAKDPSRLASKGRYKVRVREVTYLRDYRLVTGKIAGLGQTEVKRMVKPFEDCRLGNQVSLNRSYVVPASYTSRSLFEEDAACWPCPTYPEPCPGGSFFVGQINVICVCKTPSTNPECQGAIAIAAAPNEVDKIIEDLKNTNQCDQIEKKWAAGELPGSGVLGPGTGKAILISNFYASGPK